ncbi:hypothetical protein CUMW_231590 [Citrus unshiu]|uniref:DOG1 domain-containing protein n=1 Tax=Citrus unshiu TaxID=55188 RepID=A0A2H5QHT1_CITUN|nr:hypothetical protein CUMW_231590 [Citrus unshiu]
MLITLDIAATQENPTELLFPSWCNSLEISFLFLRDLHPCVFTNLVRSLLYEESEEEKEDDDDEFFDNRLWHVFMAWRNMSKNLMSQIEQIECGLRLMVLALIGRIKKVQSRFVRRIADTMVLWR